jgi:hypothetical protein
MTESTQIPTAQNTIQDLPEYNAENAKNPKEGSDWLGGPQNGNETPSNSTEGAYSLGGWSGSIQEDWNSGHPGGTQNSNDNGIDRSIDSEDANRVKGMPAVVSREFPSLSITVAVIRTLAFP